MEPPAKRQRLSGDDGNRSRASLPRSLTQPVSPPPRKSTRVGTSSALPSRTDTPPSEPKAIKSPFQLTWIRDLPKAANTDAVTLRDLLGDPLIEECWEFNYLHDIDFLLSAFDEDVRQLVQVHVVHGSWKREDPSRIMLQQQAERHKNVTLHCAFMPEPFGTHHSKMMILIRHDASAQVIIHTANMIEQDWANMTQAVWQSPLLPRSPTKQAPDGNAQRPEFGSGAKFKTDLLNYLKAYDHRRITCRPLIEKLENYDFSAVKAALVASVPGRHSIHDETEDTKWGWAALRNALRNVPVQDGKSEIVVQISSIATLGPTDNWLRNSLFSSLKASKNNSKEETSFKVVFPTPDEIRRSLDGYNSGGSIHTKTQSAQQAKQLNYLRRIFCHWSNDAPRGRALESDVAVQDSGRARAAPHIKTYIRYGEKSIDWALTTSANLSKQAWGEAVSGSEVVRIASWEIGVLVWPSLFANNAKMVGTFQKDTFDRVDSDGNPVVALRVPYNLPLQAYGPDEMPWVATASYDEPDWKGQVWP